MKKIYQFVLIAVLITAISCSGGGDNVPTSILSKGSTEERVLEIYKLVSTKQSSLINSNTRAIPLETNKLAKIPDWLKGTWDTDFEYSGEKINYTFVVDDDNIYLLYDNIASDLGSYVLDENDETVTDTTYSVIQNGYDEYPPIVFTMENESISWEMPIADFSGVATIKGVLRKVEDIDMLSGTIIPELVGVKGIMIEHNPLAGLEEQEISTSDLCSYFDVFFSYDNFRFSNSGIDYVLTTGENGYSNETSRYYSKIIDRIEEEVGNSTYYYAIQDSIQYTSFNYDFEISDGNVTEHLILKGSYTLKIRSNAKTHSIEGSVDDITIEKASLDEVELDTELVKAEFKKFANSMLNRF